jgi:saccharopine dehydrogenase-like NADP-dependent oxidoreductase
MRKILIIGAGKSSISLIDYLCEHAASQQWTITVADLTADLAMHKTLGRPHTQATAIDVAHVESRQALIASHDLVISMLPAVLHTVIASDCLQLRRHLVTPSYISPTMQAMAQEVTSAGLIFMNEMGLDPGIDHMSAMQLIHRLQAAGHTITSFKSHCGGLVAPESDTNPWHYKFSWNPRNVITAGQGDGGIRWREAGELREISYQQLFASITPVSLGQGKNYDSYPNRDSLKYISMYGLDEVSSMYRGTLRVPPYCTGWDCMIRLGLTDTHLPYTYRTRDQAAHVLGIPVDSPIMDMLSSTGIFEPAHDHSDKPAAELLQQLLETRWQMLPDDKDLVVMVHEIEYEAAGSKRHIQSSLEIIGTDSKHTAMAKTVGLPLAIVTKLILNGDIATPGVLMPITADIYEPVLVELADAGIVFDEQGDD